MELGCADPFIWFLRQAAANDVVDLGRVIADKMKKRRRLVFQDRDHSVACGLSGKWLMAGHQFVKKCPETEDVARRTHFLTARLFGRHIVDGTNYHSGAGVRSHHSGGFGVHLPRLFFGKLGDAEIEDLHQSVRADHHIFRLYVAVDDPGRVGGRQAGRYLQGNVDNIRYRKLPRLDDLVKRLAFNVLGGDEIHTAANTGLVDRDYVRMI